MSFYCYFRHVAQYKPAPPPPTKYEGAGALTSPAPSIVTRQTSPPPKPKTPLPDFISQFKGHEWFDKYFPNANENVSVRSESLNTCTILG